MMLQRRDTHKVCFKEITVKTALTLSKLRGLDYALNPYMGCEHACVYCYSPCVLRWDKGKWGDLVKVKINLPRILSKKLRIMKKGTVGLGTVTDPYQPAEKKYEITQRCLELLLMHDFPVCIQTKSSLVLRDMDLLRRFSEIEVGVTLTVPDDGVGKIMEPGASGVQDRLSALSELSENGIDTWVFLGPVMPYITDVEVLIDAIASVNPKYVIVDRLRLRDGMLWEGIREFIQGFNPDLLPLYERIFFGGENYYRDVFERIMKACREKGLRCEMTGFVDFIQSLAW